MHETNELTIACSHQMHKSRFYSSWASCYTIKWLHICYDEGKTDTRKTFNSVAKSMIPLSTGALFVLSSIAPFENITNSFLYIHRDPEICNSFFFLVVRFWVSVHPANLHTFLDVSQAPPWPNDFHMINLHPYSIHKHSDYVSAHAASDKWRILFDLVLVQTNRS